MRTRTRGAKITHCVVGFLIWIYAILLLSYQVGCASGPIPFETGEITTTPLGCQDLRNRGGDC